MEDINFLKLIVKEQGYILECMWKAIFSLFRFLTLFSKFQLLKILVVKENLLHHLKRFFF